MKNKKDLRIVIGILIVLISFIISSTLIILKNINRSHDENKENNIENNINVQENGLPDPPTDNESDFKIITEIKDVASKNDYFTVKSIIDTYNMYCKKLTIKASDVEVYKEAINESELQKYKEETATKEQNRGIEGIYSMLDATYIKNFGITKNVIKSKFGMRYDTTIVQKVYVVQNSNNVSTYFVWGNYINTIEKKTVGFNIGIVLDNLNNTFCIYPQEYLQKYGYNKLNIGDRYEKNIENIEENNYNTFEYKIVDDVTIVKEYFDNFMNNIRYNNDNAYNLLNKEYLQKRFGNKDSFLQYIIDNDVILVDTTIEQYKKVERSSYTDYVCADQYNNIYIFRQQGGVMNYTVYLDNYTVMLDEDVQKYNSFSKFEKGKYNLSKFIKMVNTKDYNAIYNVLNTSFKNNNFKNVSELKKYIKNNFYDMNSIEIEDYDKDTYEYYVFNCKITNLRDSDEAKKMTIIINQTDGTDFEMSFSFN